MLASRGPSNYPPHDAEIVIEERRRIYGIGDMVNAL